VFSGYLDDPVRTEEAFDGDGWFRTGDIGRFDALGNLTIVDRKKELIVTSGGKNGDVPMTADRGDVRSPTTRPPLRQRPARSAG
jgi:hypothetical protein